MGAVDRIFDVTAQMAVGAFFGVCHAWHVLCDVAYGFRKWGFRYGMRSLWKAVREFLAFLFAVPCRVLWFVLGFAGAVLGDLAQCMLYLKYFMSYRVLRIDRWCLAIALLGLSASALAEGGTRWAFPAIPPVRHVDSESSVCVPVTNGAPSQTEFGFDLSFAATASNNVAVAMGEDRDGDGDLSFSEKEVVVGWDCGRYFLDRPKAGRRYESARYAEPKDRTLSYVCRMAGLGGGIGTFRIDVDEGALGPDGVVADGAGEGGLWSDALAEGGDRHRIRWEISRDPHVSSSHSYSTTVRDVVLSGGLIAVSPSSVVSGGRVAANVFGVDAKYVLYSSGAVSASAGRNYLTVGGDFYRAASGYAGLYIDVVGAGDVFFQHDVEWYWYTRVYVDDELVASYGYSYSRNERRTVHVGSGAGAGVWCWKPGWNMLRITRRGRFRDSGPSGGFTLRQRGGIIQLH